MKNILYIHGFNGSPNGTTGAFVKSYFEDGTVFSSQFDLLDYEKTMEEIEAIIRAENINYIIAHSFGAFYAFALQDETMMKIVINPCMFPSVEIPKLLDEPLSKKWVEKFEELEEDIYSGANGYICQTTFGIFGNNDELFSYVNEFDKIYGTQSLRKMFNYITVSGGHQLSGPSLEKGIFKALYYAEVFDPNFRVEDEQ